MTEGRPQQSKDGETQILGMFQYNILQVWGASGARPQAGGLSGLLDFVIRALRALRPCDPRDGAVIG